MPHVKARPMAFTNPEESVARRLAVGVAVIWPLLSEMAKTTIIAQVQMLSPGMNLNEAKADVEAFVASHGAD